MVGPGRLPTTAARDPDAPALTASVLSATEVLLQWNIPASNGTPITGFDPSSQWDPEGGGNGGDWDADQPARNCQH